MILTPHGTRCCARGTAWCSFRPWREADAMSDHGMFRLTQEPIDAAALRAELENDACGGVVIFEGIVRDHNDGRKVLRLEYEAYEALALKEGAAILAEVARTSGIAAAVCVHRLGPLAIGDAAVWVGVASAHRGEAFDACRRVIDEVKARVPIWKREHYADGTEGWVNCADHGH